MPRKRNADRPIGSALGGASDANRGGGSGSGVPDAEINIRTAGRAGGGGDVRKDREKLFPETRARKRNRPKGKR